MFDATSLDPAFLAFAAAVLVLAGFVKGVIGLGLPTISVGLLGTVMAPVEAAALLVLPNLLTNAWQLWRGPDVTAILRRLWPMLAGIVVGTLVFLPLVGRGGAWATGLLGLTLVVYAGLGLAAVRFHVRPGSEGWAGSLVGFATGGVTALTGVFVVPAVPYLQALGLGREDMIQALGLSFLVSSVALGIGLAGTGFLDAATAGRSLLALLPAFAGMAVGTAVRGRLSPETFRRAFFAGLVALGAYLVWRAVR